MKTLVTPLNFSWIDDTLCRCTFATSSTMELHNDFVKSMSIRAIVNITGKAFTISYHDFLSANNIALYEPMASSPSDKSSASEVYEFTVTDEWLKSIVELVITLQASYRVWLVGSDASLLDCLIVACIRRVYSWSLTSTLCEFRLLSGPRRHPELEQIIEQFSQNDLDLVAADIPDSLALHYHYTEEEKKLLREIMSSSSDSESESNPSSISTEKRYLHSDAELALLKKLFFGDGFSAASSEVVYDPNLSLILDKEDDD